MPGNTAMGRRMRAEHSYTVCNVMRKRKQEILKIYMVAVIIVVLIIVLGIDFFLSGKKKPKEPEAVQTESSAGAGTTEVALVESDKSLFFWDGSTIKGLTPTGKAESEIVIPADCNAIAEGVFQDTSVRNVLFAGSGDVKIDRAFSGSGVVSVTLSGEQKKIGEKAFYDCKSMWRFSVPGNIEKIGYAAFFNCDGIKELTFEGTGVREIEESAFRNTALETVELPEGLEKLGNYAFYDCTNLKSVTIPSTLWMLGMNAFGNTQITDVTFPADCAVNSFDWNAFGDRTGEVTVRVKKGGWMDTHREFWQADKFKAVVRY